MLHTIGRRDWQPDRGLWRDLHAIDPGRWLLGTEGVAVPWLARELSPAVAARSRFFVAQRAPFGFYGFEAMALILDAIAAGGSDRAATVRAARSTRDRDSVLGRYSIDEPRAHDLHEVWVLRRLRRRTGLGPVGRPAHVARQRPEV
jgi:hypothetical protein